MMKKRWLLLLLWMVCLLLTGAMAETVLDPQENRQIQLMDVGLNEVDEGISPTTGRKLNSLLVPSGYAGLAATGRYLPMLVQIGNDGGGVGNRMPWGVSYADVFYETPLTRSMSLTSFREMRSGSASLSAFCSFRRSAICSLTA